MQELERRDLETAMKQNSYWMGSLQTVHMLGWDPISITRRQERIEKLTPEVLHETFKKYFPMDRHTVVTLKPETAQYRSTASVRQSRCDARVRSSSSCDLPLGPSARAFA